MPQVTKLIEKSGIVISLCETNHETCMFNARTSIKSQNPGAQVNTKIYQNTLW